MVLVVLVLVGVVLVLVGVVLLLVGVVQIDSLLRGQSQAMDVLGRGFSPRKFIWFGGSERPLLDTLPFS